MTDWSPAIAVLEAHKDELQLPSAEAKEAFLSELRAMMSVEKEDRKAATQIAVDAAKTFVQIAIAFIVASVGFAQFSFRSSPTYVRYLLLASGVTAFVSMCFGFVVISKAYKRADGRTKQGDIPWSTENVKSQINLQAITGLVCLLLFVIALSAFNWGAAPKQLTITLPDKTTKTVVNLEPMTISGEWSNLGITQTGFTVALDKVPPGQKHEVRLDFK